MQETLKPNILMLLCAIGCLNIVTAKHLVSKRSAILNEGKSTGSVNVIVRVVHKLRHSIGRILGGSGHGPSWFCMKLCDY